MTSHYGSQYVARSFNNRSLGPKPVANSFSVGGVRYRPGGQNAASLAVSVRDSDLRGPGSGGSVSGGGNGTKVKFKTATDNGLLLPF